MQAQSDSPLIPQLGAVAAINHRSACRRANSLACYFCPPAFTPSTRQRRLSLVTFRTSTCSRISFINLSPTYRLGTVSHSVGILYTFQGVFFISRGDHSQSTEQSVAMSDRDEELSSQNSLDMTISTLCETCERMAHTFRLELDEGEIERDIDGCQTGAVAECPFCLLAWREILKLRQQETTKKYFRISRIWFRFSNYYKVSRTFYFYIRCKYSVDSARTHGDLVYITLSLHPLLGLNLRTAQLAAKYEYPPRTDAESVAKLIQSWYLQCTTQHPRCASQVSTYQPPRLVEIQKDGFRLVVTSDCGMEGSYATLSHCWGNAPNFLKLTSTNIEQLRQWNPTNRLPQTFQDAACLCYHLHIKYL
jgi:hypothetical protein